MCCLFFTIPADGSHQSNRRRRFSPSRWQTALTWFLVLVWLALVSFGAISLTNPQWLQEWGHQGVQAESRAYKQYGDSFLHQGDYRRAIAHYQKSLQIYPQRVSVMINLAVAYMYAGFLPEADQVLRAASRLESNRKDLISFNLGELMERQGKTEEAIRYYKEAIGSKVDQGLVYRKLGLLYLGTKRYEEALEAFEKTLANQTDVKLSYMDMLNRSLDDYEDDTVTLPIIEAQFSRGVSTEDLAPYDLKIIRHLQQTDPEIAKTHNHLAYIHAQRKDYSSAARHYQRSLEIWPGNIDAQSGINYLAKLRKEAVPSDLEH
jgi:tetratricopeptide (TPR) repeat protein